MKTTILAAVAATFFLCSANAQLAPIWGQCGGISWAGPTACTPGNTCTYLNPYRSQCLPTPISTSTTTADPLPTSATAPVEY